MRASRTSLLRALRTFMTIQPVLPSVNKALAHTNREEEEKEYLCYANSHYNYEPEQQKEHQEQITLLNPHKCNHNKEETPKMNNNVVFMNEKNDANSAIHRANALRAIRHRRKISKNDMLCESNKNLHTEKKQDEKEALHEALDAAVSFGKSAILIHTAHQHIHNSEGTVNRLEETENDKQHNKPQATVEYKEEEKDNLHAAQLLHVTENKWNKASEKQKFKWVWATPQGRYALRWFASKQQFTKTISNNNYSSTPFIFTLPISRRRYQLYHINNKNNNYLNERLAREHLLIYNNNSKRLDAYNNSNIKHNVSNAPLHQEQEQEINSIDKCSSNDETEIRLHTQLLSHKVQAALSKRQTHQWRQHVQDMLGLHGSLIYKSDVKALQSPNEELENVKEYEEEKLSTPEEEKEMKKKKCEESESISDHRKKPSLAQQRLSNRHFARLCKDLHICRSPRKVFVMQRLLPILREHEAKESTLSLKEVSRLAHLFSQQYNAEIQSLKRNNSRKKNVKAKNEKDKLAKVLTEEYSFDAHTAKVSEKNASVKQSDITDRNKDFDNKTIQKKDNNINTINAVQEFNEKLIDSEVNNIHDKLQTFQRHVPLLQRTLQVVMRSTRPENYPHSHPH